MPESLPSQKTVIADIPEVRNFKVQFNYNFFQADERTNDSGRATKEFILKRASSNFDAQFIESDQFNRFTSRYIRLDWQPVVEVNQNSFKSPGFKIIDNIDKIYEEQHFIGDSFINVTFQDLGADEKLKFFVQQLYERQQERDRQSAFNVTSSKMESPLDFAKGINQMSSKSIDFSLITEAVIQPDNQGYIFRDRDNKAINNQTLLKELKNVQFFNQLNNKFMVPALKSVSENSMSAFKDEIDEFIGVIENIQEESLSAQDSSVLNAKDYELEITDYVDYEKLDPQGHEPRVEIIGYLIEKIEVTPEGNSVVHDPIVIENPNVSTAVDVRIKYGTNYKYSIRSIALFETQADDAETNETVIVKYLIASKPSHWLQTETVERVPPPPPADFNVRWDALQRSAVLEWCFPVNPQRDIKGWQIFRRENIGQPFELQAVYDFDDSVLKSQDPSAERPDPSLVKRMTNPKQFYVDKEFNKDSKYIYAVCSVDARGLGSNYSQQFEVSFDRFKNKIKKRLISPSDAPKPYPNFFLNHDTFVDTIRDSGHRKMRIAFNPEYLKVVDSENNNLQLLKTNNDASYQISVINVDLQVQKNIAIKLNERRQSADKNVDEVKEKRLLHNRREPFERLRKSRNKK